MIVWTGRSDMQRDSRSTAIVVERPVAGPSAILCGDGAARSVIGNSIRIRAGIRILTSKDPWMEIVANQGTHGETAAAMGQTPSTSHLSSRPCKGPSPYVSGNVIRQGNPSAYAGRRNQHHSDPTHPDQSNSSATLYFPSGEAELLSIILAC